jgi:hypothetical protein
MLSRAAQTHLAGRVFETPDVEHATFLLSAVLSLVNIFIQRELNTIETKYSVAIQKNSKSLIFGLNG